MSLSDCGPAVVSIYGDGRREMVFLHRHDGGEAYMGPLLRKAVQYAKTHYDSGNIADVLMSEGEMCRVDDKETVRAATDAQARHLYYVTYKWNLDTNKKTYKVHALHLNGRRPATEDELRKKLPVFAAEIPENTTCLA